MNVEIFDKEGGLIQVTLLSLSEHRRCGISDEARTALLTTRSKDHDLDADMLEKLGRTCLKMADKIRERK